jgi:hypothetical protein
LFPNILLSDPPDAEPLTKYGMMRKNFLKQYRPITYSRLVLTEKLFPHCRDVQQSAESRLEITMEQLIRRDPPPDKVQDGFAWVAHMNALKQVAEESIFAELVYGSEII